MAAEEMLVDDDGKRRAAAAERIVQLEAEINERRAEIARLRLVADGLPLDGPEESRDESDQSELGLGFLWEALHGHLRELLEPPEWIGGGSNDASNSGDGQRRPEGTEASEGMDICPNAPPARAFDHCKRKLTLHKQLPPPPFGDVGSASRTQQLQETDARDVKIEALKAVISEDERYMKKMLQTIEKQHRRIARLRKCNSQRKRVIARLQSTKMTVELELIKQVEARNNALRQLKSVCKEKVRKSRRLSAELAHSHSSLEDETEKLRAEIVKWELRAKAAEEKYKAVRAYSQSFSMETSRFGILL